MKTNTRSSIRDALYEAPGPKTKRVINIATVLSLAALAFFLYLIVRRFYETGQLDSRYWSIFLRGTTWKFMGKGLLGTLEVAIVAGAVTFCAGFCLMVLRISGSRIARGISIAIIEFTRGVPTLLLIYFFFLVVPSFGIKLPPFWKVCLPVSISASGIVAEVLRSGVNAVPKGQKEAAMCLGMQPANVFLKVVFPQAFRFVIPALISEMVIVVKDTTFAYVVNYPDLMQNAKVLISNYDALLAVYFVVGIIYIIINWLLNKLSVAVGNRTNRLRVSSAGKES